MSENLIKFMIILLKNPEKFWQEAAEDIFWFTKNLQKF